MRIAENRTNWKFLIGEVLDEIGEAIIHCSVEPHALEVEFDPSTGKPQGPKFTAWTPNYVLFPCIDDGYETVGYVPRHYQSHGNESTDHIGVRNG